MFSAVHPTTDIAKILRHVRFVPFSDLDARSHEVLLCLNELTSAPKPRSVARCRNCLTIPPYVGNMGYNSGRGPWRAAHG